MARFLLWFLACLCSGSAIEVVRAADFQFEPPTVILSTQDMERNGLMFPDGTMGFVRQGGRDPYFVSGSGGRSSGVGISAQLPAGSYGFAGSLESFHPAQRKNGWPTTSLSDGLRQPSPDQSEFDRDYAGGGPTYSIVLPPGYASAHHDCADPALRQSATQSILLQIYHGEYHLLPPKAMPAYGGSGMAISCDGGATFGKIGQILAPHVSREQFIAAHPIGGLWADGAMIEADARGQHICREQTCAASQGDYFYLVFTDRNSSDERYSGLSIARVPADDLLRAVSQHRAPQFKKYYNPGAALTFDGDHFTELGIGGRSTPVVFVPGRHMNTPGILFDSYIHKYVLYYQADQKQVALRTSIDLMNWSAESIAFQLDPAANVKVFYPAAAGIGADPQLLDQTFYLYFLVREQGEHGFANPRLLRERVTATP